MAKLVITWSVQVNNRASFSKIIDRILKIHCDFFGGQPWHLIFAHVKTLCKPVNFLKIHHENMILHVSDLVFLFF